MIKRPKDQGATGEWVGVMGFRQDVKMAARLLFTQRKRVEIFDADKAGSKLPFTVILARRAPLVTLDLELVVITALP